MGNLRHLNNTLMIAFGIFELISCYTKTHIIMNRTVHDNKRTEQNIHFMRLIHKHIKTYMQ